MPNDLLLLDSIPRAEFFPDLHHELNLLAFWCDMRWRGSERTIRGTPMYSIKKPEECYYYRHQDVRTDIRTLLSLQQFLTQGHRWGSRKLIFITSELAVTDWPDKWLAHITRRPNDAIGWIEVDRNAVKDDLRKLLQKMPQLTAPPPWVSQSTTRPTFLPRG